MQVTGGASLAQWSQAPATEHQSTFVPVHPGRSIYGVSMMSGNASLSEIEVPAEDPKLRQVPPTSKVPSRRKLFGGGWVIAKRLQPEVMVVKTRNKGVMDNLPGGQQSSQYKDRIQDYQGILSQLNNRVESSYMSRRSNNL